ncbi:MAG: Trypsin-like serine protease [Ignavibacteria bacterium]|nr:Trypsin-like serine protease [Ignavibacteria bacterium]
MKKKKAAIIASGVFAAIIIFAIFSNIFAQDSAQIGADKPPVQLTPQMSALNEAFVAVSNSVNPIVVSISVKMEVKQRSDPYHDQFREFFKFFGQPPGSGQDEDEDQGPAQRAEASGSGVIITKDGYIVTNNHVVENATEDGIEVTTIDHKVHKAKLIGTDPLTDLAVVKIEGKDYPTAHFATIENVRVGEWVVAVGNPLGLNSTVTQGIISAIGRGQLGLNTKDRYAVENFIQTDAPINPGNSGGGLFNLEGSLVGINTAIATRTGTYIGYGFAIPIDMVKAVVTDLITDGKINRGYMGVEIKTIDETDAKSVGLDDVEGVLISNVYKDSPADKAGVERGDVVLEIDGKKVKASNELQRMIVYRKAGEDVKLTIWRDGKKIYKTVKLEERKDIKQVFKGITKKGDNGDEDEAKVKIDEFGFTAEKLTKELKEKYEVESGVFISAVDRYSIAAKRGLAPNGIIIKADRKPVNNIADFKKIVKAKNPGDAIMLQVKYNDSYRIVTLEIPEQKVK